MKREGNKTGYLIRTTREKLLARREEIVSNLPMSYAEFKVKVNPEMPLANKEWLTVVELGEISSLLGESDNP